MKNKISLIYRILIIVIGVYGLYLNLFNDYANIWELLHYFTILTNIMVILLFVFLIIKHKDNKHYPHLKGAITMSISVTFLIFHFVLRPTLFNMTGTYSLYSPANLTMHYIVPIMTIFDWILFDKKGLYNKFDPLIWLIIPIIYFIIMSINGALGYTFTLGGHYPYFFMDWNLLGAKVLLYVVGILVAFTILGYIYYGIDILLSKNR